MPCSFVFWCFIIFVFQNHVLEKITIKSVQKFLAENEVDLSCSHAKLCFPVIDRIYRKMLHGISFSGIKVDGDLICDGHHRYVASLMANVPIERIPSNKTNATIVYDWKTVDFLEEEWDTPAKIKMLNQQDAEFNNISIDTLVALLK